MRNIYLQKQLITKYVANDSVTIWSAANKKRL